MAESARILIVDDLPENLDILGGLLEPEGYIIGTARDGLEAVERAPRALQSEEINVR